MDGAEKLFWLGQPIKEVGCQDEIITAKLRLEVLSVCLKKLDSFNGILKSEFIKC
jgi:hypothetical protein